MHIGVFLGPFSRGPEQDVEIIDFCIEQAIAAANAGFSMVTFGEQHFNNYEPYCNPFMMGAHLAPHLKDTWFGTTVLPLPFHHPFRLAEQMNLLDVLTRGKVVYGISAGRPKGSADHANFGIDPDQRHEVFNTKLDLLLRAFAHKPGDPAIEMETPWGRGRLDGRLMPTNWRKPRPLLAHATSSDDTIAQAAARCWPIFMGAMRAVDIQHKIAIYREAAAIAGHEEQAISEALAHSLVTRHVFVAETDLEAWSNAVTETRGATLLPGAFGSQPVDAATALEMSKRDLDAPGARNDPLFDRINALQSWIIAGSPDSVAAQIEREHANLGIQLLTRFASGLFDYEKAMRNFSLFAGSVMPRLPHETFEAPPAPVFEPSKVLITPH